MRPAVVELQDGTLAAFMTERGELTTKEQAAYAVLTHPDGGRTIAVKRAETAPTIREG